MFAALIAAADRAGLERTAYAVLGTTDGDGLAFTTDAGRNSPPHSFI